MEYGGSYIVNLYEFCDFMTFVNSKYAKFIMQVNNQHWINTIIKSNMIYVSDLEFIHDQPMVYISDSACSFEGRGKFYSKVFHREEYNTVISVMHK